VPDGALDDVALFEKARYNPPKFVKRKGKAAKDGRLPQGVFRV
jgi:hypothetical protein